MKRIGLRPDFEDRSSFVHAEVWWDGKILQALGVFNQRRGALHVWTDRPVRWNTKGFPELYGKLELCAPGGKCSKYGTPGLTGTESQNLKG